VFSFSGRNEVFALEHPVADLALGILDEQPALRALHEHDERDHDDRQDDDARMMPVPARPDGPVQASARQRTAAGDNARKDDQRDTVADAARVICSPSHIRNMVPPTSVITVVHGRTSPDR
jgi:hypothetical protein